MGRINKKFSEHGLRTGRLDNIEAEFIKDNRDKLTVTEIASRLSRRPATVRKYIKKLPQKKVEEVTDEIEVRPFWEQLKKQLTEEEIASFKEEYVQFIDQFKGDVRYTEIVQICDAIMTGILANRCLAQGKIVLEEIAELERNIVDREKKMMEGEDIVVTDGDKELVAVYLHKYDSVMKDYQTYINMKNKSFKDLKATRDQRFAKVESARTSFSEWMKSLLENYEKTDRLGKYVEKSRLAADKEKRRLSQPYKYDDEEWDIPFLTPETIIQDYEELNENAEEIEKKKEEEIEEMEKNRGGE